MARILIKGLGLVFSGDFAQPRLDADAILIEGGKIAGIGTAKDFEAETTIDAQGCAVMPGLIDNHVHPAFGDWTPRQNQLGFIEAMVHGGTTTLISAGEVHLPGRPKDAVGVKALAIAAQRCFAAFRPMGARVLAGAPVPERGFRESDYQEMAAGGVTLLGEIGLGTLKEADEVVETMGWARKAGLNAMIHCGGPSIAGSNLMQAEVVIAADADIVAHINGGPTSLPAAELTKVIAGTKRAIEIVHNGNPRNAIHALKVLTEMGRLDRLVLGTDSPAGSGVQPLGVMRTISLLCSLGGLDPAIAIAAAGGNTARWRNIQAGVIKLGAAADLVFLDAPIGGAGRHADEAFTFGELPGIGMVMVDGEVKTMRSRNTPPAARIPTVLS
ncbi:amidohydrolase family protein [Sediminicoccus rosea]|jgi:enamidase|uniref:Amidohydrolase family protein n=1 Tax=Sediminicoccus rosea TaxID=1225128 RepID=A0ABZ0PI77_9PROT|nr:amidohydrolase family protein [Sediminicoccus rosea]WPB85381.1 amidohydrolase family protein [Sediminicoccus rosea]